MITASSSLEFVTKLRESSKFNSECTDQEYMINFAHRQNVTSGAVIRTDTASHFCGWPQRYRLHFIAVITRVNRIILLVEKIGQ